MKRLASVAVAVAMVAAACGSPSDVSPEASGNQTTGTTTANTKTAGTKITTKGMTLLDITQPEYDIDPRYIPDTPAKALKAKKVVVYGIVEGFSEGRRLDRPDPVSDINKVVMKVKVNKAIKAETKDSPPSSVYVEMDQGPKLSDAPGQPAYPASYFGQAIPTGTNVVLLLSEVDTNFSMKSPEGDELDKGVIIVNANQGRPEGEPLYSAGINGMIFESAKGLVGIEYHAKSWSTKRNSPNKTTDPEINTLDELAIELEASR